MEHINHQKLGAQSPDGEANEHDIQTAARLLSPQAKNTRWYLWLLFTGSAFCTANLNDIPQPQKPIPPLVLASSAALLIYDGRMRKYTMEKLEHFYHEDRDKLQRLLQEIYEQSPEQRVAIIHMTDHFMLSINTEDSEVF